MKSTLDKKSMAFVLWFQVHKIERSLSSLPQTLCQIASSSGKRPVRKRIQGKGYLVENFQIRMKEEKERYHVVTIDELNSLVSLDNAW
jgi:hypothetical protein